MRTRMAKRAQRKFRIAGHEVEMNVVSLIDIFAILVFYLLVNALAVEVLPNPQSLQLPKSVIKEEPKQIPVIVVTKNDILVDNVRVMGTDEAMGTATAFLPALKAELLRAPLMRVEGADAASVTRGDVNIMADKAIPYQVLKKVMATCTEARFAKISLAVVEKKNGGAP
ncbi:ExbD/TolR family protein [Solimonas variicoloris]|uniref:ExbD/TolR family protein n=1 Tax=Solimonas variicoloris TaxID=254408 RepID=UPI0005850832|nr:biopolymer transporter ExbD [Solimonas variicoloris]